MQAAKRRNGDKPKDARASTTDADARVITMGDGGFRPTFNVQLATTCEDQVIVGVAVTNLGSDVAQMPLSSVRRVLEVQLPSVRRGRPGAVGALPPWCRTAAAVLRA